MDKEYLGAKVTASIKIKETQSSTKEDIKGSVIGKLVLGKVTAKAKAALKMLDTNDTSSFETTIKWDSKPTIETQPTNIDQMLEGIESMPDMVRRHVHTNVTTTGSAEVCGVALRFELVPIIQYVNVEVEKLYLEIKEDTVKSLVETLAFLRDCQMACFLSKKILERQAHLKILLLDRLNPLTVEINREEDSIRQQAKELYLKMVEIIKYYKCMKADAYSLLKQVQEVKDVLSLSKIQDKVDNFIKQGHSELLAINFNDIQDTHKVKVFTNTIDMEYWFQPQKPNKLFLKTGGGSVRSTDINDLYDISSFMSDIGVEIGVAVPNISDAQFNATLKINGKVYKDHKLPHLIAILQQIIEKADPLTTTFLSLFACQNGAKFPSKDDLFDLPNYMRFYEEIEEVKLAGSYLELRSLCLVNDYRWKLVMNMAALDSCGETISKFRYLRQSFGDIVDWIIGAFEFESATEFTDAPLIMAFRNGKLVAQCLDNLDILILTEVIITKDSEVQKSLLDVLMSSYENVSKYAFVKPRASFAAKVMDWLVEMKSVAEEDKVIRDTPGFPTNLGKCLKISY